MLKTKLTVEIVGEPNIQALSENEQHAFLDVLFARIMELYNQHNNHD